MSERQYNVACYEHDWKTGEDKLVIPYKTGVTLAEARGRLGNSRRSYANLLVYRDISDWKLSAEPTSGRVHLYNHDRKLFDQWDNQEQWHNYDEYSVGEGEPLEGWATHLFDAMGPDRAKAVHRALAKVLHPDNQATGDDGMFRELNGAYEATTNPQPGIRMPDFFNWGQS